MGASSAPPSIEDAKDAIQEFTRSFVALARAIKVQADITGENRDQQVGIDIVRRAIRVLLRQIAQNAGQDGPVVAGEALRNEIYSFGHDAQEGDYKDLVRAGLSIPRRSCALRSRRLPR